MQTIKDNAVNDFLQGEPEELSDTLLERMEGGNADGGLIAKMPKPNQEVEINGLKFNVQQVTKSGNVILEPQGK